MGQQRNFYVDLMRGVSILLVMTLHFSLLFSDISKMPWMAYICRNGYYGVTTFFAISGYLITSHIIDKFGRLSQIDLRSFFIMRIGRIAPPLLVILALLTTLSITLPEFAIPSTTSLWKLIVAALTFTFNVLRMRQPGAGLSWDVLWSLSIEEVFYLTFPLLCRGAGRVAWAPLIAIVGYGLIYRLMFEGLYDYGGTFDCLALGCLAAIVTRKGFRLPFIVTAALLVGALALYIATYALEHVAQNAVWGPTGIALSAAILLFLASRSAQPAPLVRMLLSPLQVFGRFSYELYLLHGVVVLLLRASIYDWHWFSNPSQVWVTYGMFLAITLLVSAGFGLTISSPANRAIRKLDRYHGPGSSQPVAG